MAFQKGLSAKITALEQERYALRLKLCRVKTTEEDAALKEQAKEMGRVDAHNSEKDDNGVKHIPIDISLTAVGMNYQYSYRKSSLRQCKKCEKHRLNPLETKGNGAARKGCTVSYIRLSFRVRLKCRRLFT